MKRFHRSFLGLMEMNNEGEWVRYKDVRKVLDSLEEIHRRNADLIYDLQDDLKSWKISHYIRSVLLAFLGIFNFAQLLIWWLHVSF